MSFDELQEIDLAGGAEEPETVERVDRDYFIVAKLVWEASQHVKMPGLSPLDFCFGMRSLMAKTKAEPLPDVRFPPESCNWCSFA